MQVVDAVHIGMYEPLISQIHSMCRRGFLGEIALFFAVAETTV